jgi:hypothetical protein
MRRITAINRPDRSGGSDLPNDYPQSEASTNIIGLAILHPGRNDGGQENKRMQETECQTAGGCRVPNRMPDV